MLQDLIIAYCPLWVARMCPQPGEHRVQHIRRAYYRERLTSHRQAWPVPWIRPWLDWLTEPRFELWRRALATLAIFMLLQAGNYIPVPGVLMSRVRGEGARTSCQSALLA